MKTSWKIDKSRDCITKDNITVHFSGVTTRTAYIFIDREYRYALRVPARGRGYYEAMEQVDKQLNS